MNLFYQFNQSTQEQIHQHLQHLGDPFLSQLSGTTVHDYSHKLFSKAQRLEIWDKSLLVCLGAYYYNQDNRTLYLSHLGTLPNYQGNGLAKHNLNCLKTKAQLEQLPILLAVHSQNQISQSFYQKNGFIFTGQEQHHLKMSFIPQLNHRTLFI